MPLFPAEPFTSTRAVLYPGERGFVLKPPGFGNLKCSPQMRIGSPQPENRVLVCKILYWQFPDFIERHCRIRQGVSAGVLPRQVGHDHLERAGRQFRRRRFQLLGLLEHREPAEGTGAFAASVHLPPQVAVLFRFLLSCVDNRLGAFDGRPAEAQVPGDVVAGVTGVGLSVAAKKGTKMAAKWSPARGAIRSEPFPLLRSVVRNGPERSRARRCWARRSEPLTARTVLRGSLKRERRGERLAKSGPPFWYPGPPPLTVFHRASASRACERRPPECDASSGPRW